MAKSKHLSAYKEAQLLVNALHQSTKKAPRELRHTLVQRLLNESVEMIVDIDAANRSRGRERARLIKRATRRKTRTDVLLFVAMDQRCLSIDAAGIAMEHVDSLGKQLHGWLLQTQNQLPVSLAPETESST